MRTKSSTLTAKEAFLSLCQNGTFSPGSKIPSEQKMAQMLGVSRETWRKAIELLRSDGILASRHGSGTYLLEQPHRIGNDLAQLQSMSKMIIAAGIHEQASEFDCSIGYAPDYVASFFHSELSDSFLQIQRVRHSDVGIISASLTYLPMKYAEGFDMHTPPHSLFSFLEENHSITIGHARTELLVPSRTDPLCQLLQLTEEQTALGFQQYHFDKRGNPIFYSLDILRSDLFHFTILRTRP